MASRAERYRLTFKFPLSQSVVFCFYFLFKSQINDLAVLVKGNKLSETMKCPICYISCYALLIVNLNCMV